MWNAKGERCNWWDVHKNVKKNYGCAIHEKAAESSWQIRWSVDVYQYCQTQKALGMLSQNLDRKLISSGDDDDKKEKDGVAALSALCHPK